MLEIQTPALLPALLERLEANGCETLAIGDRIGHVVQPDAVDAAEEWCEVRFFVRAWGASQGGVEVTLRPDDVSPGALAAG
jgi:hypothetical protein